MRFPHNQERADGAREDAPGPHRKKSHPIERPSFASGDSRPERRARRARGAGHPGLQQARPPALLLRRQRPDPRGRPDSHGAGLRRSLDGKRQVVLDLPAILASRTGCLRSLQGRQGPDQSARVLQVVRPKARLKAAIEARAQAPHTARPRPRRGRTLDSTGAGFESADDDRTTAPGTRPLAPGSVPWPWPQGRDRLVF